MMGYIPICLDTTGHVGAKSRSSCRFAAVERPSRHCRHLLLLGVQGLLPWESSLCLRSVSMHACCAGSGRGAMMSSDG